MDDLRKNAKIETHENVTIEYETANVGTRMIAYIIDIIILYGTLIAIGITVFILSFASILKYAERLEFGTDVFRYIAYFIIAKFILDNFYFIFFERIMKGQTPGKKVMKLRVISTTGEAETFLMSVVRNFFRIADQLPAGNLIGGVLVFFGAKSQRLGDRIANTMVVKVADIKKFSKYIDELTAIADEPDFSESDESFDPEKSLSGVFSDELDLLQEYLKRRNGYDKKTSDEYDALMFKCFSRKLRAVSGCDPYRAERKKLPALLKTLADCENSAESVAAVFDMFCIEKIDESIIPAAGINADNDAAVDMAGQNNFKDREAVDNAEN